MLFWVTFPQSEVVHSNGDIGRYFPKLTDKKKRKKKERDREENEKNHIYVIKLVTNF